MYHFDLDFQIVMYFCLSKCRFQKDQDLLVHPCLATLSKRNFHMSSDDINDKTETNKQILKEKTNKNDLILIYWFTLKAVLV